MTYPIVESTLGLLDEIRRIQWTSLNAQQVRGAGLGLADHLERQLRQHAPDRYAGLADYLIVPHAGQTAWCAGHRPRYHPCETWQATHTALTHLLTSLRPEDDPR